MSVHIDINCDMGESYGRWKLGHDEEIMPHITSATIACGFHGGDPHVMRKTVELAVQHGGAQHLVRGLVADLRRKVQCVIGSHSTPQRYRTALAASTTSATEGKASFSRLAA